MLVRNPLLLSKIFLLVDGLKHTLLSISQLYDKGNKVTFDNCSCTIESIKDNKVLFIGQRVKNIYFFNIDNVASFDETCNTPTRENKY